MFVSLYKTDDWHVGYDPDNVLAAVGDSNINKAKEMFEGGIMKVTFGINKNNIHYVDFYDFGPNPIKSGYGKSFEDALENVDFTVWKGEV